ncbi:glycosyltransferase [Nakamurella flavida]|uniref:Glycosyltransferase n=1 Tax=Nakamurella flavida TaxID=363630 RepID=A0A938YKH7_9ACTN|nr:glycosyltransferase [Nakamurella flavida]MBM9475107.1 glycosyltransferase [Nakamurella flavida]MDP9776677.1 glycosyltransferase involved in cell wall biosynthesis [Nakamurella flavida]
MVHVITTLTTGGAERQVQAITAHSRHPTTVIALYHGGVVADAMAAAGQDVQILGGMDGWAKLTAVPRLARSLRRLRPDVVQVHLLSAQLWAIPAARLARIRTVISTEHSLMDTTIENRPLTPQLKWLYRGLEALSTHTVAVSRMTRTRLLAWGVADRRITVVDNGIDFAALRFDPAARDRVRSELGIGPDVQVVGGVGRLEPVKRFPQLLEALAPTLGRGRRELVLAGDGPLRAELVARAQALGVADAVHVLGPRGDVPAVLAAMDVLVSPSRDETFGMAVIEGMGAGLPVAYAQCPALDELSEQPASALPLAPSDASADAERVALVAAVEELFSRVPADRTRPDADVVARYGIEATARRLDDLAVRLARR